jgi:hypothetical protein
MPGPKARFEEGEHGIDAVVEWGDGATTRVVAREDGGWDFRLHGRDGVERVFRETDRHGKDTWTEIMYQHLMPWRVREREQRERERGG